MASIYFLYVSVPIQAWNDRCDYIPIYTFIGNYFNSLPTNIIRIILYIIYYVVTLNNAVRNDKRKKYLLIKYDVKLSVFIHVEPICDKATY